MQPKGYTLAMGIMFNIASDLPREIVRRITIPAVALKELRNKILEGIAMIISSNLNVLRIRHYHVQSINNQTF